jgi:hypothetical protein
MATLAQRISDVVTAIGNDIKTLFTRSMPSGGTTGQVLAKNSATNYDASWQTPSGGGGSSPSISLTTLTVATAKFEQAEVLVTDALSATTSMINVKLLASDEFDLDDLYDVEIKAEALNGQIRFTLFSEIIVGNYSIAYQVFN